MTRKLSHWGRVIGAAAVIAVVLPFLAWRVGTGPFLEGVRSVNGTALAAAPGSPCDDALRRLPLAARGTGPRRGALAARRGGVVLPLPVPQQRPFPGGVLGDVHRAVRHGRRHRETSAARLRAVVWDRMAGQLVQTGLTLSVLLADAVTGPSSMPRPSGACRPGPGPRRAAAARCCRRRRSRTVRAVRTRRRSDLREGLLARRRLARHPGRLRARRRRARRDVPVAARTVGLAAPPCGLVPLALLVLLAMAVPAERRRLGPREGVAAWAFARRPASAPAQGVATCGGLRRCWSSSRTCPAPRCLLVGMAIALPSPRPAGSA